MLRVQYWLFLDIHLWFSSDWKDTFKPSVVIQNASTIWNQSLWNMLLRMYRKVVMEKLYNEQIVCCLFMAYRYIYWNHELQDAHILFCKCTETGTNFLANFQFRYQQQRSKQHQDEGEKQFVWDILWKIYSENIHSLSFKWKISTTNAY